MYWNYGEKFHFWTECTRPKWKHNKKSKDDDSINSTKDIEDALILSLDSSIESYILDSSASFHLSPNKKLFRNFKSGNLEKAYLTDNKALEIERNGMFL